MFEEPIITQIDALGRATLTLNRPELHNAFDDALIALLTAELKQLEGNDQVRMLFLASTGKSFSAGGDIGWMRRMADYTREENLSDAGSLAELMRTLNDLNKPTIALVQGAAFGGGVGLVACCDIAVATRQASFCLSEVKIGLIPAVISPYVVASIGSRACRRYFLTAEKFDATEAHRLGMVHEVVNDEAELKSCGIALSEFILKNGPNAVLASKKLIASVYGKSIDEELIADTAKRITDQRASAEGREGLSAFLEKRKPAWITS